MATVTYADTTPYLGTKKNAFDFGELRDCTVSDVSKCDKVFNIIPGTPEDPRDKLVIIMALHCEDFSKYEGKPGEFMDKEGKLVQFTAHPVVCKLPNFTCTIDGMPVWGRIQIQKQENQRSFTDPSRI